MKKLLYLLLSFYLLQPLFSIELISAQKPEQHKVQLSSSSDTKTDKVQPTLQENQDVTASIAFKNEIANKKYDSNAIPPIKKNPSTIQKEANYFDVVNSANKIPLIENSAESPKQQNDNKYVDIPYSISESESKIESNIQNPNENITQILKTIDLPATLTKFSTNTEKSAINNDDDLLIPPANVSASIAKIDAPVNMEGQIIISSDPDCPSLESADNMSQTQLIKALTHKCRYDLLERPIIQNDKGEILPVNVYVRLYYYYYQNLGAADGQFKIQALFQQRFVDPRLAFREIAPSRTSPIMGEGSLRSALWGPHIFFVNERGSSILGTIEKDILTSISPDGTVILSARIQATLSCRMGLQKFPFDEQECSTVMESWMYNTSDLRMHWEPKLPVTMAPKLHLTAYVLLNSWTSENVVDADTSDPNHGAFAGNYSSLRYTIHISREVGFYLIDYFLPSIMIVSISWVSFWLQADQGAPRVLLGTNTMLAFITLSSGQTRALPKVGYIKVSEVWFLGCTAFIFGSLVEFAFVNTIWRRKKDVALKKVNSKYILKSTLTPRPYRKEMPGLQKSNSCASLNASHPPSTPTTPTYNNFLTVHGFKSNVPKITTQSVDDGQENGGITININPSNSTSSLPGKDGMETPLTPGPDTNHYGWTTMTPKEISTWIDRRSRVVFPVAFAVFNAFFWTFVYLL